MEAATHPLPPPRRRRKRRKKIQDHITTISDLPSHITSDILSRLPLKSIFRCKRVCKIWRDLILEPYFAKLHLSRSPLCLIFYRRSNSVQPQTSFGFLPLDDSANLRRSRRSIIKFETVIHSHDRRLTIVNSANGLVCLSDYLGPNNVFICNPTTRQHFLVPECKNQPSTMKERPLNRYYCHWFWYGLGYSPSTDLHKVVRFTANFEQLPYRLNSSIYTLGVDGEWRNLGNTGQPLPNHSNPFVFLNGALHWIGSEDLILMLCYFDMEKEQCGNLPLPCQLARNPLRLGIVDNCLYVCEDQTYPLPVNIWVMKDYGNLGSWTLEWIIQPSCRYGLDRNFKPVKTLEDGRILMIVGLKTLAFYNPVTRVLEKISYHGVKFWEALITDVPSFLPLP